MPRSYLTPGIGSPTWRKHTDFVLTWVYDEAFRRRISDSAVLAGAVRGHTSSQCRVAPAGLLPPPGSASLLHGVKDPRQSDGAGGFSAPVDRACSLLELPRQHGRNHNPSSRDGCLPGQPAGFACDHPLARRRPRRGPAKPAPHPRQSRTPRLQHRLRLPLKAWSPNERQASASSLAEQTARNFRSGEKSSFTDRV